jgi:hypothetical protein
MSPIDLANPLNRASTTGPRLRPTTTYRRHGDAGPARATSTPGSRLPGSLAVVAYVIRQSVQIVRSANAVETRAAMAPIEALAGAL